MAKNDQKKVGSAIDLQRSQQQANQNTLRTQTQNRYNTAYGQDQGLKQNITEGYQKYLDPEYLKQFSAGMPGGGVSGGISGSSITNMGADPYAIYKKFSEGGGISPEFTKNFEDAMGQLDQSIGGYQDFMKTGGFSPQDLEMIRQNAMAPITGTMNAGLRNVQRNNVVSGGSGGNYNAAISALQREGGRQVGDAAVANEANMAQQIQQGKEFGTTGLEHASTAKAAARMAVQELDAQLRLQGAGGMTDIEKARLQAQLENAHLNQSAGAANASLAQRKAEFEAGLPLEALRGMTSLYGTSPADTQGSIRDQLDLERLSEGGNIGLIGEQINAGRLPSSSSQIMGNIGSVASLFGTGANIFSKLPFGGSKGSDPSSLGMGDYQNFDPNFDPYSYGNNQGYGLYGDYGNTAIFGGGGGITGGGSGGSGQDYGRTYF